MKCSCCGSVIPDGILFFDILNKTLHYNGKQCTKVSPMDYKIIKALMEHFGEYVMLEDLLRITGVPKKSARVVMCCARQVATCIGLTIDTQYKPAWRGNFSASAFRMMRIEDC